MSISRKTILVVEDDPDIRQFLADTLLSEGYEVVIAANGQEALAELRRMATPSLILLDLVMPVMNGWDLMEALRADAAWSQIPVVVMSATPQSIPVGVRGVLAKPGSLETLLETLAQCIERRAESRVAVRLDVAVRFSDSDLARGVSLNLSRGGILFQVSADVTVGAPVSLTVTLAQERTVSVGSQVRHVSPASDGDGVQVGACFVGLDEESGRAIGDALEHLVKR